MNISHVMFIGVNTLPPHPTHTHFNGVYGDLLWQLARVQLELVGLICESTLLFVCQWSPFLSMYSQPTCEDELYKVQHPVGFRETPYFAVIWCLYSSFSLSGHLQLRYQINIKQETFRNNRKTRNGVECWKLKWSCISWNGWSDCCWRKNGLDRWQTQGYSWRRKVWKNATHQ